MQSIDVEKQRSPRLQFVRNHQTVSFFVLTIALTWATWIPVFLTVDAADVSIVHVATGAFGPFLAGVVVTWASGYSGRSWIRSVLDWRTARRWYLAALAVPLALGAVIGLVAFFETRLIDWMVLAQQLAIYPIGLLLTSLIGGGQEELGWRGFALPRLQERYDALVASLVVGIVWAMWHLPLFAFESGIYSDQSFLLYVPAVIAFSVLHTWLYNGSGGTVAVVVLLHGGINAANGLAIPAVGGQGAIDVPFLAVVALVSCIAAIAVVVRYGRDTLADGPAVTPGTVDSHGRSTSDAGADASVDA